MLAAAVKARFSLTPAGARRLKHQYTHLKTKLSKTSLPIVLTDAYLEQCDERPLEATQKLLVIEIDRLLVFPERYVVGRNKQSIPYLPRPYLSVFREYISHPTTTAWLQTAICTTHPRTIAERMVREGVPLRPGDFTMIYTPREMYPQMSLEGLGMNVHPKDLEVLWDQYIEMQYRQSSALTIPTRHSATSSLLVDIHPRSGAQQPHNFILFPEYEKPLRRHDLDLFHAHARTRFSEAELKSNVDRERERVKLERRFKGYKKYVVARKDKGGYDDALIALVGLAERLKTVRNVAAWIRGGGIFGVEDAETGPPHSPAAADKPWFDTREVFEMWAMRGRLVANQLGIALTPGVVDDRRVRASILAGQYQSSRRRDEEHHPFPPRRDDYYPPPRTT